MFSGKKILLGITGSIAAYKSILLIRLLIKNGAEVKVILTPSAKDFVTPLTLSTLSKNEVLIDLFDDKAWSNHVELGRWADVFVIAPASCNTLAKMATGLCDNLLMATYLSATCPVIIAPAMDEDMWKHASTKDNIQKINSFGNKIIPIENGELASGLFGDGRMAEPETIVKYLKDFFLIKNNLRNKKILITAGPTQEALDPVRFISNHSTGKMGIAIAEEAFNRGAEVILILGPSSIPVNSKFNTIEVTTAKQMKDACVQHFAECDIIIMAAAVADYAPEQYFDEKIKKHEDAYNMQLKKTDDILKYVGENKKDEQILVGFALETNNEKANALNKLKKKNADLIVLNSLQDDGAGFGKDTNKITIFDKRGNEFIFETKSKQEAAADIMNAIIQYQNA